jgi:hypothetical protein
MSKKTICLACLVFVLGIAGTASADLIGRWKFDEFSGDVAADSSGNGYDGTIYGGPAWIPGQNLAALRFDGTNDYVGTGVSLLNNMTDFSMTGWVSARNPDGSRIGVFGQNDLIEMGFNTGSISIWTAPGGTTSTAWTFPNDTWHHVAIVDEGTDMMIYLDGELAVTGAGSDSYGTSSYPFNIGGGGIWDATGNWFSGAIDDVRLYNHALSEAEIQDTMETNPWPYAASPSPADGAIYTETWASMAWVPGAHAVSHDIYFGENFDDVNDGTGGTFRVNQTLPYFVVGFVGYPYPDGLVPGTTYYWRVDEVNGAEPGSPWKGAVWSFTIPSRKAHDPAPVDGAEFIFTDTELSWTRGLGSKLQYLYFGETFEQVETETEGQLMPSTSYKPAGLEPGKTYYWRVDQADGTNTYKGDVWSFTTLPEIPISDPNLIGWWKLDEGAGSTAVDWSGHGNHGTLMGAPQWVEGFDGGAIQLDGTQDYVEIPPVGINSNTVSMTAWVKRDGDQTGWSGIIFQRTTDRACGMGFSGQSGMTNQLQYHWNDNSNQTYNFSSGLVVPDNEWAFVALVVEPTKATLYLNGTTDFAVNSIAHITQDLNGSVLLGWDTAGARYVQGAIDDARIYDKSLTVEDIEQVMRGDPYVAWDPNPANRSTPNVKEALPMTWSAGEKATQHDVYFGTDRDAVNDADTTTADIYRGRQAAISYTPPEGVEWGSGPFYWRIDEYNNDGTISKGRIWTFTVADFILIDDFEQYDAGDNQIWYAWHDGLGYGAIGTQDYYPGNGTGSAVGDETTPSYTEETIVHGGKQSMPFTYDNNKPGYANYSEVELTLSSPRDWTEEDVAELSIWFRGYPASTGSFVEGPVGTYTMTGSGADIWRINGVEADEFHFAYKMLAGAGSITARVLSVDDTDPWAKAGVMIRETLNPDSAHAFACITPDNGVASQGRPSTGGVSFNYNQTGVTAPYWVKVERSISGNFTVSHSSNGTNWQAVTGALVENIPMSTNVYIGLAVTAHNASATCQAVFSNVTTSGNVTGQWQHQDIGINSNDAEPLYAAVLNSAGNPAIVVHTDPAAAQIDTWTEWVIQLSDLADQGINLTDVDRLAIGLGTRGNTTIPGGSGKIFIDDIRLYRSTEAAEAE